MTALDAYAKLEAEGQYFDGISDTPHAVMVSFGERSLVISDFADAVLAHWPLASLKLHDDSGEGGDATPEVAVLPDLSSAERVVLTDAEMIAAIGEVCPDLGHQPASAGSRYRPGLWLALMTVGILIGLAVYLPSQTGRLASIISADRAQALGAAMADRIAIDLGVGTTARQCRAPEGLTALRRLTDRLLPADPMPYPLQLRVLDVGEIDAIALPGGTILILRGLLDEADTPEEVAAVLAHLIAHVGHGDPLRQAMQAAGIAGAQGALTGDMTNPAIVEAAVEAALEFAPSPETEAAADLAAFTVLENAGLPSLAYANLITRLARAESPALARHPDPGDRANAAIAADRIGARAFAPALDDRAWISLQNICEG